MTVNVGANHLTIGHMTVGANHVYDSANHLTIGHMRVNVGANYLTIGLLTVM